MALALTARAADSGPNWAQWRGPLATGAAPEANPPLEWSETKNIKWKVRVPGEGDCTPIIWGNRVFILTAVSVGEGEEKSEKPSKPRQFIVICYDRQTGKVLWQKIAREEVPHEWHQQSNTYASQSPVTDGKYLITFFGSHGLYCYDLDGNLKWQKDFGKMQTKMSFGEGASVALSGDIVVVPWDHEGDDFVVGLDKATGKELWRQKRDEATGWTTPLVVEVGGKKQVVLNASRKVRSYDLATGAQVWECGGQTANAIPTPVAADGIIYVTSGFRGNALQAIRLGKTGDLTGTDAIIWHHETKAPYVPSPLLSGNLIYVGGGNDPMLSCYDAKTGEAQYEKARLEGIYTIYASPVAAKGRIYVLSREGTCVVLKEGAKPEVLAKNKVDDQTDGSLAMVGKEVFLRGHANLYCIEEK